MEIREKVYTLHRYVDENGVPDLGRIFSKEGESPLRRHLDPQLKKIWHNQPKEVQDVITGHLGRCGECKEEQNSESFKGDRHWGNGFDGSVSSGWRRCRHKVGQRRF